MNKKKFIKILKIVVLVILAILCLPYILYVLISIVADLPHGIKAYKRLKENNEIVHVYTKADMKSKSRYERYFCNGVDLYFICIGAKDIIYSTIL